MKPLDFNLNTSITIVSNATSGGGAEKSMLALHKEFINVGLKSNLIALNKYQLSINIPNVIILNRRWKSGYKSTVSNYFKFKKIIKDINPDILILNCELPELYGSLLNFNGRIICVEHTTIPWHGKRNLGKVVRILLRIKHVKWVTVIKGKKDIWFGKEASSYIPNPYLQAGSNWRDLNQPSSLTFIGGIKKNKRPEWVIKAGIACNLDVYMYGDGPLKKTLEEKYKRFSNNIKFYGFELDVWDAIPNNTLIVVPSEFEGDGMVVMEAILSGRPVVLAKNEDLKRFGLEEINYFENISELCLTVNKHKKNGFKELIPSDAFISDLKSARSIIKITEKWLELFMEFNYNPATN